jgi:anti-sigma-K factor RskA
MEANVHELTAGYALDALDPTDREAFERHLGGCEQCRQELASFWEVTNALAVAAGGPAPSVDLRDRILADARAEPQTVVAIDVRRRPSPVLAAATAIAAAVAIGIGIYAVSLGNELNDTRAALASQEHVANVLADPEATTLALQPGTGRLVVAGDSAVLVLDDLAAAPIGKTYQAWVVDGQTPVSAGTFDTTGRQTIVPIPLPVSGGAVVAVTVEESGGASEPTLPPLAASEPA